MKAGAEAKPTRVRHQVVVLTVLVAMITYIDRVCIATLAPHIMAEFSLTKVQMGYVFSAFALAYAAFEIPTARIADRLGTKIVLTRIVIWWSTFTMATGAAFGYVSLLVFRFLFGVGEAGAWPTVARTFSRWIPLRERGRMQGIFFSSAFLAAALTPALVTAAIAVMPWRLVFVCLGLIGWCWAGVWSRWYRNEPAEHPAVNRSELELILAGRSVEAEFGVGWRFWRRLFVNRNVIALCLMYFPNSFVFYFCITWLPTYLQEKHGFDSSSLAFFTGLPLFLSIFSVIVGGMLMDHLTARFGARIGRCGIGGAAYAVAAAALAATPACSSPVAAVVCISIAVAASMATLSAAWGTCMDLGGKNAGVVSATMNTASQIGSLLCPLVVAYTLKWYSDWNVSIYIMGFLFLVGAVCWLVINPAHRISADKQEQPLPALRDCTVG